MKFAAVEGGGTSWAVAIMEDTCDNIIERTRFVTTTPEETLGSIKAWLSERTFDAIGVASFGPIDANLNSEHFGYITSTPKPNWAFVNVLGLLGVREMNIPFRFDTDVNAPAYAEFVLDGDSSIESCAYITVGTGIGVGLVCNGKTVHGLMHPEAGGPYFLLPPSNRSIESKLKCMLMLLFLFVCNCLQDMFELQPTPEVILLQEHVLITVVVWKACARVVPYELERVAFRLKS